VSSCRSLPAPGADIASSLAYTLVLSAGSLVGGCALGAYLSDASDGGASIIGASIVTIVSG